MKSRSNFKLVKLLLLLILGGCQDKVFTPEQKAPDVSGRWVSAVIKLSPKATHTLWLAKDGTFREEYEDRGKPLGKATGTYKVTLETLPSMKAAGAKTMPMLNLYAETLDGRSASKQERRYPRRYIVDVASHQRSRICSKKS